MIAGYIPEYDHKNEVVIAGHAPEYDLNNEASIARHVPSSTIIPRIDSRVYTRV